MLDNIFHQSNKKKRITESIATMMKSTNGYIFIVILWQVQCRLPFLSHSIHSHFFFSRVQKLSQSVYSFVFRFICMQYICSLKHSEWIHNKFQSFVVSCTSCIECQFFYWIPFYQQMLNLVYFFLSICSRSMLSWHIFIG